MPKYIATLDFSGVGNLYGNYKRNHIYDFVEDDNIKLLLKVGYLKHYDLVITDPTIQKELKQQYETKELKTEQETKVKRGRKKKND